MRRALAACCVAALGIGCKRLATGAREDFAQRYSCPDDRVTVKARDDLHALDVIGIHVPDVAPPAEVQSDPGRLAKWQADRAKARERLATQYSAYDVFEARGCDHFEILACHHPLTPDGRGTYPALVSCQVGR